MSSSPSSSTPTKAAAAVNKEHDVATSSTPGNVNDNNNKELDTPDLNKVFRNLSLHASTPSASAEIQQDSPHVRQHQTKNYSVIDVEQQKNEGDGDKNKEKDAEAKVRAKELESPSPRKPLDGLSDDIVKFINRLEAAKRVIVMCGAGLSVSAGIPDFRTPGTGLYSQLAKYKLPAPEAVFEINFFKRNPEPFRQLAAELWPGQKYLPTKGHYFIKMLHDKGKLLRCYTQNIDSLECMTGLPKDKIVAAHGNFDEATCVFTGKKVPVDEVRDAYLNNTMIELNAKHKTKLVKPDIVFFGEGLPDRFHQLVPRDFPNCDLLIVMGTSLQVHPFASLINLVPQGSPRMLINRERVGELTSRGFQFKKGSPDVFLKGDCDEGCQKVADALGWGEELIDIATPRL